MSDLGLLSHQYQIMAKLARQLRHDVLLLKRLFYGLAIPENITDVDVQATLKMLQDTTEFLSEVIPLDEKSPWPDKWLDDPPLPNTLVEQLRRMHSLDRPLYVKALQRLVRKLQQDVAALKERDILLLEEIAQSASSDANTVFRRLMRWA